MKIGFALITSSPFFDGIISIENSINREAAFFETLGPEVNLPHTTIFQGNMSADINYKSIAAHLAKAFCELFPERKIFFKKCVYVPDGWYFLECLKTNSFQRLHDIILEEVKPYIVLEHSRLNRNMKSLTEKEIVAIKKYGYRYAADAFYPHITIGRNDGKNEKLLDSLNHQIKALGNCALISRITVYAMGNNGTHHETLYEAFVEKRNI